MLGPNRLNNRVVSGTEGSTYNPVRMVPVSRPDGHLSLGYIPSSQPISGTSTGSNSPTDHTASSVKSAFGASTGLGSAASSLGATRLGAGSPLDMGARLYSKRYVMTNPGLVQKQLICFGWSRAREIQAQEGVSPNIWGPPSSGHSTPLRENIPESPGQDEFPDLIPSATDQSLHSPARRTRAGTMPSRFPGVGSFNGSSLSQQSLLSKTSRPTPSTSPFRPPGLSGVESASQTATASVGGSGTTLSRLRAGSMPQRTNLLGASSSPFGPSLFSTHWSSGRERASTLASIRSSEGPTSPAQSSYSRDGLADTDVKTLDYLGLAETPQQQIAQMDQSSVDLSHQQQQQQQQSSALPPLLAELAMMKNNNRFRSYSVNAKEQYAEDDEGYGPYSQVPSGTMTPSAAATAAQLAATQAQIHQHNLAVQAFASQASVNRPRARTAGVLETPPQRSSIRNYLATPSRLDHSISASDLRIAEGNEYEELSEAVQMMHMGGENTMNNTDNNANTTAGLRTTTEQTTEEGGIEGPTRALWIGSIPVSTTVTSLDAIFGVYGKIESTRVLTHKNCGFVNYERIESAIQAKSMLNGKEIFPGAGPVRIGYAKVPGTPTGPNGAQTSTPDPNAAGGGDGSSGAERPGARTPHVPPLPELQSELTQIVREFGASDEETRSINASVQRAIAYKAFVDEIPPIPEPSPNRIHDAPTLRDIRKRIDHGLCTIQEIEEIAHNMLPEIAELSSDYIGNTVVQKLFEYCSEPVKEQMLIRIAPHLAEIGVHKNGTWAAQKIIDVTKTASQMQIIVDSLRPYTVPLFLDQYGNYVLQCCLRFGRPYNDFIFETMLSRIWEIAQGRFGARAMRACLESHHTSKEQQRMLAAAIALHSVKLVTNSNGAILLTWYLDTWTFPRRRTVLAPRLVPHLVHLCTHKVAYLTVLKVINQRNEPEAREIVLKALFFSPNDEVLENILRDHSSGATLIFKVLTTPFFDESMRAEVVKNVAKVLTKLKVTPSQGYKRLMDEVGLSSRGSSRDHHGGRDGGINGEKQHRPTSRHTSGMAGDKQSSGQQYAGPMDNAASAQRNTEQPIDYNNGLSMNPAFGPEAMMSMNPQQLQYQAYLQSRGLSPANMYPAAPMGGNNYAGFPAAPGGVDNLRGLQPGSLPSQMAPSPMLAQPGYVAPQYSPALGQAQMYYPSPFYPQAQAIPNQPGNGRRGRV